MANLGLCDTCAKVYSIRFSSAAKGHKKNLQNSIVIASICTCLQIQFCNKVVFLGEQSITT